MISEKRKNICVFCGSRRGNDISYSVLAQRVGKELARRDIGLVYGGGNIGLMGDISNEVLKYNGCVTGVIPDFMIKKELANTDITKLIIVETMHERKAAMAELSNGFIILPGGIGTMDEFFEIWTWTQLGLINHPIGILNYKNYFEPLKSLSEKFIAEEFLSKENFKLLTWSEDINSLLDEMGF